MAPIRRVPELRPGLLGGRALPAVRSMRVGVDDDGAVVLTDVDGSRRTLLAPGAVHRILHVEPREGIGRGAIDYWTGPLLVLVDGTGDPLLALRLHDWCPPSRNGGAEWRAVTGVTAFAAALDLPVEPAGPRDLPGPKDLRRVLLRPVPSGPWPGRWGPLVCSVALVLAVLSLADPAGPLGAAQTVLAFCLVAPVVVSGFRARAASRRAGPTPGRERRTVVRPRPTGSTAQGLLESTLEVGTDEVVLTDRGREVWLPGPPRGGVARAVVAPESIQLTDADGQEYAVLSGELWAPTAEAREELGVVLDRAGLEVVMSRVATRTAATVAAPASARIEPSRLISAEQRGDQTLGTPWLSGIAAMVLIGFSAVVVGWNAVLGGALVAGSTILFLLRLSDLVRTTVSDRRALRTVAPGPVAALR
jgi:hypothetical protein